MEALSLPSDRALKLVLGALWFALALMLRAALRLSEWRWLISQMPAYPHVEWASLNRCANYKSKRGALPRTLLDHYLSHTCSLGRCICICSI